MKEMRIERRAVLVLCIAIVIASGCNLSTMIERGGAGQRTTMRLSNFSSVAVEATNLSGRLTIQTGKNITDFEAIFPSGVESNVTLNDRDLAIAVSGPEQAAGARSRVVVPAGKELSLTLNEVFRPLDVVIDYATAQHLRARGITSSLTVKLLSRSHLNVVLESGHGSVELELLDGAEVRFEGNLNGEQMEALTKLGFVQDGSAWIRTTKSSPTATVRVEVEGWTGVPGINARQGRVAPALVSPCIAGLVKGRGQANRRSCFSFDGLSRGAIMRHGSGGLSMRWGFSLVCYLASVLAFYLSRRARGQVVLERALLGAALNAGVYATFHVLYWSPAGDKYGAAIVVAMLVAGFTFLYFAVAAFRAALLK